MICLANTGGNTAVANANHTPASFALDNITEAEAEQISSLTGSGKPGRGQKMPTGMMRDE